MIHVPTVKRLHGGLNLHRLSQLQGLSIKLACDLRFLSTRFSASTLPSISPFVSDEKVDSDFFQSTDDRRHALATLSEDALLVSQDT